MRLFVLFFLSVLAFSNLNGQNSLTGATVENHSYDSALKESIENYTVFQMDIEKSSLDFVTSQNLLLNTGPYSFDLTVYPNNVSVRSKNKDIPHLLSGHSTNGENINLTINDDFIFGFVKMGNARLFMEPLRYFDKTAPRNYFVLYYDYDVIHTDEHKCGVETSDIKTEQIDVNRVMTDECVIIEYALANTHDMVIEFGTVADVEDFNLGVLNTMQENYRSEFDKNVEFFLVEHFTPATAGADPFTSSANAVTLLNDFANWADGGGNFGGASGGFGIDYQMAGLWTDRDIFSTAGNGTVGIAYTPGWHHLFENFTGNAVQLQVMTSHEVGHNFSAVHDGSGSGFIMAPSVNGTDVWSFASIDDIDVRVAAQGYLDDCSDQGAPVANFNQSTILTCEGSVIDFEDQSQYGATRVWEFDNGTPATSTDDKVSVTYNTQGLHYVKLTSTNDAGSDEYTYYVDVQTAPGNPCFPTGSGGTGGIVNVSLLNVSNPSDDAADAGRYEDFVCEQIMNLEESTNYNILISTSGSSSTNLRLYLDYNNDGDFTDSGESEGNYSLGGGNNYLIPLNTNANPVEDEVLRLRIINDTGSITSSCENPTYSQVEDYGVVFSSGFTPIFGCTDPTAGNYDPTATVDDGTCDATAVTWYRDFDSDDFGDPNTTVFASIAPPGYISDNGDCDDTDDTVYPGAPEICDGIINNCNLSVLLAVEIDNDLDGYVECNYNATTWKGSNSVIGGNDCDDTDATKFPNAPELCDGQINDCNQSTLPANEVDNDLDGYVECAYNPNTWVGSAAVIGGGDCDDADILTFPGAPELCDGKINNCNLSTLPANESDADNDGYVECIYVSATWAGDPNVVGGEDCNDSDDSVYPGAPEICDGQRNNCDIIGIPGFEIDNDNDGYVECNYSSTTWAGDPTVIGGNDCQDNNNQNYPGNNEVCDGQDNDCDGFVDEGCFPCDGVDIVINTITQNNTSAEQTITATAVIDEPNPIAFFAGQEIEFGNGFEVLASTEFFTDIEDCITSFTSGGVLNFTSKKEGKEKLLVLIEQLEIDLNSDKEKTLTIMDLDQKIVFNGKLSDLKVKSHETVADWFDNDAIYITLLTDGEQNALGKFTYKK